MQKIMKPKKSMVYFTFISLLQLYVALIYSLATNVFVCNIHVTVCVGKYLYVSHMYSCGVLVTITFELQFILMILLPPGWQHLDF